MFRGPAEPVRREHAGGLIGAIVAISGNVSAAFIIMVNGWMNSPAGFDYDAATRTFSNIDPVAAMWNAA